MNVNDMLEFLKSYYGLKVKHHYLQLEVKNEIDRFLNAWVRMMPFQKSIIFCWKTSEAKAMAAADAWMELECEYKEQMKKEKSLLIIFDSL